MRSQVQWLPVLYVEPIYTCCTNKFSVAVGSIVAITSLQSTYSRWIDDIGMNSVM